MSDMRLIVAGAGGRMGRTLIKAIAETKGAHAVRRARRRRLAADRAECARTRRARRPGHRDHRRCRDAARRRRRHHRLHRAAGDRRACRSSPPRPASCMSSAPPASRPRTKPRSRSREEGRDRQVRQHEPRRQSAGGAGQAGGEDARRGIRHRDRRDASQQEDRRAVRHRAAARPRGGGRPRHRSRPALGARARRPYRRAPGRRYRLCDACAAAPWSASTT